MVDGGVGGEWGFGDGAGFGFGWVGDGFGDGAGFGFGEGGLKVDEAAGDGAALFGDLVGVGEVEFGACGRCGGSGG